MLHVLQDYMKEACKRIRFLCPVYYSVYELFIKGKKLQFFGKVTGGVLSIIIYGGNSLIKEMHHLHRSIFDLVPYWTKFTSWNKIISLLFLDFTRQD